MRSATSFFNKTLFTKNIKRFWFIWALYSVVLLFAMPINLLLQAVNLRDLADSERALELWWYAARLPGGTAILVLQLAVVLGVVTAMALFSYLYSSRAAGAVHTLPIRREGLFFTNILSGLLFFWVPNVVVFLLTLLCEAVMGCLALGPLLGWLAVSCGETLFFFGLAVFCAMLTGHMVALPVFYAIANGLAAGIVFLVENVLREFVFGFAGISAAHTVASWLTPVVRLTRGVYAQSVWNEETGLLETVHWTGLPAVGAYALAAVVLLGVALLLYRRRAIESAGDVVAVGWVRPIFRYGVAACFALSFGQVLYAMFYGAIPEGAWSMLVFLLICGAVGYFIASMLLAKSFRVLRRWKGCVAFLIVLMVLTAAMEADLIGYERRVPDPGQVTEVTVSGIMTYPHDDASLSEYQVTDPERIAQVVAIQEEIVRSKSAIEKGRARTASDLFSNGFSVTYRMKNGTVLSRDYGSLPIREEDLKQPGTYAYGMEQFVNLPESVCEANDLRSLAAYELSSVQIEGVMDEETGEYLYNETTDSAQLEAIRSAMLKDFSEGNLGRHSLMSGTMEDVLTLYYEIRMPADTQREDETYEASSRYASRMIALTGEAVHTMEALEEAGLLGLTADSES